MAASLRRIGRGIRGFARRAAPVLRNVARVAGPVAGAAAVAVEHRQE